MPLRTEMTVNKRNKRDYKKRILIKRAFLI